ncbi:MAG TPA: sulfurtransferase [Vicinamibacterales bacterium]|nr:sulfurtransferase [Vicinamibacterales bacterium]
MPRASRAAAVALALAWLATGACGPPVAPAEPASAGYARPELLVTADWVQAHAADPNVRIVDLRPRGYETAHVPGAVHLANADIRDPQAPPTFLPTTAAFEALMSRLGISNETRVVAYDDRGGIYAARLWWILTCFGHANVALLDGGWKHWEATGRPTSADTPAVARTSFIARPNPAWIATADDVLAAMTRPDVKIVDARTVDEIEGRDLRDIRRGGAIPGSIPVYWEDAFDRDTHLFEPAADIERLYADQGITRDDEIIAYCQVGMRASHDLFALHLIGYDKLRNYYGAWEEWGNRDDLPMK